MRCNRRGPKFQSLSPGEKKSSIISERKIFELSTVELEEKLIQDIFC